MRVVGIDASLRSTGLAAIDVQGNRFRAVDSCLVRARADAPLSACLGGLMGGIREFLERTSPQAVAIEGAFFFRNARTAMILGQARGVAVACCAERGVPVYEYAPRKAKQAVVGFGGAEKDQVKRMVCAALSLSGPLQDDVSDAFALAICHAHSATGHAALLPDAI
jgi:crossover junction endodeoxyribonuclease RuvC